MRTTKFAFAALALGSCATPDAQQEEFAHATVDALVQNPNAWHGKRVEVVGVVSNRFENLGLYSSSHGYCSVSTSRKAIYVRWDEVRGFDAADEGRTVVVRGVFLHENGTERPVRDGMVLVTISTGAPGPGPLTNAEIVGRSTKPRAHCDPLSL